MADFARSASGCAPWRVLRLVALHEYLAGVITFIRIAILAIGLLQYCLNLSVMPPNRKPHSDKSQQTRSGDNPYDNGERDGDVERSESGEECQ